MEKKEIYLLMREQLEKKLKRAERKERKLLDLLFYCDEQKVDKYAKTLKTVKRNIFFCKEYLN